ncbi:Glutamyl-tRNA reductase [Lunatimonas lonarensis]|uniref:Glutamyl-tRNA reductase n=1 Tax=Lunatimonas lonarensis TaxID=1232681 RepID=R7ZSX5_9BACT|nr:glutamyl-tRNA reductase [Lunatimonas lonarensis]EON77240.1 Glutamyl-tRNA reductase [Lunatimonas lonarensis]
MNQLIVFSLTFQEAQVCIREKFSFDDANIRTFDMAAKSRGIMQEWMILSTCNRTEVVAWMSPKQIAAVIQLLAEVKHVAFGEVHKVFRVIREQENSLQYFGEVAVGLRSQILGDAHLINQLKRAYAFACREETVGPYLHRLIQFLFSANKRIANETGFKRHVSSVPHAAVEMVSDYLSIFSSPNVAVVGFGQMGEQLVRHLLSRGVRKLTVYNRSVSKAIGFFQSKCVQGEVRELAELGDRLFFHDIVFSAIHSSEPLITRQMVMTRQRTDFTMIVDLSMPRTIDPHINEHHGVICLSMDHIREATEEAKKCKVSSVGDVKRILVEYLRDYLAWREDYRYLGILKLLKEYLFQTKGGSQNNGKMPMRGELEKEVHTILKQFVVLVKKAEDTAEKEFYLNSVHEIIRSEKAKR